MKAAPQEQCRSAKRACGLRCFTVLPAVEAVTVCRRSQAKKKARKKRKDTERRETHNRAALCGRGASSCGGRSPLGVPPRLLPKGLSIPRARYRARLRADRVAWQVSPPAPVNTSSDAPRAPVLVPAG